MTSLRSFGKGSFGLRLEDFLQASPFRLKYLRRHGFQLRRFFRFEIHLCEDVFIGIDPSYWATGARQIRDGGRNPEDGNPQIINARGDKAPHTPARDLSRSEVPKYIPNSLP